MKTLGMVLSLLSLFAVRPAAALVLEVPIPELTGTYSSAPNQPQSNFYRSVTIHLPSNPSVIHSVSLRVHGATVLANYSCDGFNGYGPPTPVPTSVGSELTETPSDDWIAEHVNNASGAVSFTELYATSAYASGTWAFLLDGTATMNFSVYGVPAIPECVLVGPPDLTTIDEVTLLIDGEFPTAVNATSWGSLKSIYR